MTGVASEAAPIFAEMSAILASVEAARLDALAGAIGSAPRVAIYGQGRAGLMMQAFAMRLHHLGRDAHVVGAMNAPPIGPGDLFVCNAADGSLPTGLALIRSARKAGASVALFTAAAAGEAALLADHVVVIPAPMRATHGVPGALVMGGAYELALFCITELLIRRLMALLGVDEAAMWSRHSNLL